VSGGSLGKGRMLPDCNCGGSFTPREGLHLASRCFGGLRSHLWLSELRPLRRALTRVRQAAPACSNTLRAERKRGSLASCGKHSMWLMISPACNEAAAPPARAVRTLRWPPAVANHRRAAITRVPVWQNGACGGSRLVRSCSAAGDQPWRGDGWCSHFHITVYLGLTSY